MDRGLKAKKQPHPRENANILSLLTFFYTFPLFVKGFKKDLDEDDTYEVLNSCRSKDLGDLLELQWEIEKKKHKKPSILRALLACFGRTYMWFGLIQLAMRTLLVVAVPQAMGKLIAYFKPEQTELTKEDAYYYAATVIGLNIVNHVYTHNYLMALHEFAIRVRTAICSLVYRKALRMTDAALSEITMGRIVTVITKDIFAVEIMIVLANDIWIGLVQTALISYLIYQKIGVAVFSGVGFFFIILPLQAIIGKMSLALRLKASKKTDERIQLIQQILSAIKTIKMYAWEPFFGRKIATARKKEVNAMFILFYLKIVIVVIGGLSAKIAFYLLIMTYVWMGNYITAEIVYFVMTCFGKLRHFLGIIIPLGISFGAEFFATLARLRTILDAEEIPTLRGHIEITSKDPAVILNKVTVKVKKVEYFSNISIEIKRGLNIIVGYIGSGKTTFLKTILENYKTEGTINIYGKISYASQEPWLFPSTIKNNILFGEKFNLDRYRKVLELCALNRDLKTLTEGDNTIVGDNGTNLSKGQQARVNLARAVYKNADIYLLDDCLAALDGHVSDYIFKECILNFLKDKLCILVSNNGDHIQMADRLIEINHGSVKFIDSKKHPEFEIIRKQEDVSYVVDDMETEAVTQDIYKESKKSGAVALTTYLKYLQFGGGYLIFCIIILMFVVVQSVVSYSDKLVSNWVTLEENISSYRMNDLTYSSNYSETEEKRTNLLNLYTIIIVLATALSLVKFLSFFLFNRRASISIHKRMISNIIGAKMTFFDSHFIGNVLNRFSKDLGTIDDHLPFVMNECYELLFVLLGVIILVATVNYLFLIPAGIFLMLAYLMRYIYLQTGRSLQRMDASTRSPLMGHLNASLEGRTTIRAFKAQEIIKEEFDRHQDLYTSVNYTLQNCMRSLGFVLDSMCSAFIAIIILRFLFAPRDTAVGDVGLAIMQTFHLSGLLQYGIRRWADYENQMTSVERALRYTEIDQEKKSGKVLNDWPEKGKITYENVSMKYQDDRQILKNITFTVQSQQKIGIVGRTGSGKSSLISSLFRLYDVEGTIKIDDVNIESLALDNLRSNIAIIPQDPFLVSGTIRDNIDPLNKYQDEEIWKAIKITKLQDVVDNLSTVVDSNTNFSAGQKQLICLTRALVRKNKIVVLDEATANLDNETDSLIRQVIDENFSTCTVITIAHRLISILNADVVMVVDDGRIVEQDAPKKLLENKNSLFFQMIKQT